MYVMVIIRGQLSLPQVRLQLLPLQRLQVVIIIRKCQQLQQLHRVVMIATR